MTIAQSFAYVERFLAPVLNTLDKNLFKYDFDFWKVPKNRFKKQFFAPSKNYGQDAKPYLDRLFSKYSKTGAKNRST